MRASFAFAPSYPAEAAAALAASSIDVDNLHIVMQREDGTVVLDTIVAFPPGVDVIAVDAVVRMRAPTEMFAALIQLRSGGVVLFEGTQQVVAHAGLATAQQVAVLTHYAGPGAKAARVTVSPRTIPLLAGASTQLAATVFDSAGAPISGVPLAWTSSDPTVATVSTNGLVTALTKRGTTSITVKLLSGLSDLVTASVTLPASTTRIVSGGGQSGRAGEALSQPVVVEVAASDGVGVGGIAVSFRALTTGATISPASGVTDGTGRVTATLTLGGQLGAQAFEAVAAPLAALPIGATAAAGIATQLAIASGNAQSDTAGKTLASPLVVSATDKFGNLVSGAAVAWQRVTGTGTVGSASSNSGANGLASTIYTLGAQAGVETVRASLASGASATFTVTALARPPSAIAAASGVSFSGAAGAGVPLAVLVTDALNQPVANVSVTWGVSGQVSVASPSSVTGANGQAAMTATLGPRPGPGVVIASIGGLTVRFDFVSQTGAASQIIVIAGNQQTAAPGTPVAIAPAVRALDQLGNPVRGSVTFTVSLGGGSVTGTPVPTDSTGLATLLGAWTLGPAGQQSLTATIGSATATLTAISASAGPPVLAIAQQPNTTQPNASAFATPPQIQLQSNTGAPVAQAGVPVTVALTSGGQTLGGTLTVSTNASGVAVFNGLSILGSVGTNQMQFTAIGYTSATSAVITIVAGAPSQLSAVTALSFPGTAGAAALPTPQVVLKDVSGNPVSGQTVTFAPRNAASGTVSGGAAVTAANGIASPASWTLGAAAGKDTLVATFAGVTGSPVIFEAVATSSIATQLVLVSGNNQVGITGQPLPAPLIVEARDANNNPVGGASVTFTVTFGGGTPTTQTITTAANGQASFTLTLGQPGIQSVQACLPGCAAPTSFAAQAVPVGTSATWTGASSGAWSLANNWSPAVVPSATSSVFIPAGTPNAPSLSSGVGVSDLTMASAATLSIGAFQLDVSGNLLASGATITGSGVVAMNGGGKQLAGTLPSLTIAGGGSITATATTNIAGNLLVQGSATFDAGAVTTTVSGSLTYANVSGARLAMRNPAARLIVGGDAYFNATDMGDNDLTAGTLEFRGNFQAQLNYFQAFRATGTHLTRFNGSTQQNVYFYYPGTTRSMFANVEFANAAGVVLGNGIVAAGNASVTNGATVSSARFNIGGLLTTASGTSLAGLTDVLVFGSGNTFPLIAGIAPPNVVLASGGVINAPSGTAVLPGSLIVTSGTTLDMGTSTLTLNGSLTYASTSGARLLMRTASARLIVNGDAYFNATDMGDNDLTAGLLEFRGNFQAQLNYFQSFRATGAHVTRFNGTTPQDIYFYYPGSTRSLFANADFSNNAGINLSNQVVVASNASVVGNTAMSGGRLNVGGLMTSAPTTSLARLQDVLVFGSGQTFPLIAGVAPPMTILSSGGTINVANGSTVLPGNLTVTGGTSLDVGANALTITGSLTYASTSGARLLMRAPSSHLIVGGDAYFNAADMGDNDLTAGFLEFRGNFQAQLNYFQSFRATGAHVTRFNGTTPQSIYFYYPGTTRSMFAHADFANAAGITLSNEIVVGGNSTVSAGATIGGARFNIGGLLTTAGGSSLAGAQDVLVYGSGPTFPLIAGVAPPMVVLSSGGTITAPSGATVLPGSLTVTGGTALDIGANTLTLNGSLTLANTSNARLFMRNASGRLVVNGDAYFNATDMGDTDLTAGTLEFRGNFAAQLNYFQSFRATGAHLTRFNGAAAQSIYFYYPGTARSLFAHLDLTNSGGGISLGSDVVVGGNSNQLGRLSVSTVLSIVGALNLGPTSNTTVTNSLIAGSCTAQIGAVFTGFRCP